MRSEAFGYLMSALIGVSLIILAFLLVSWLWSRNRSGDAVFSEPGSAH
jgi:hypothetical protein